MQNDAKTADHPFLVRPHRTLLGLMLPVLLSLVAEPLTGLVDTAFIARFMGATADVHRMAADYIQIRLIGAPAVLATIAAFGCLRGLQDMRVPLLIAVGVQRSQHSSGRRVDFWLGSDSDTLSVRVRLNRREKLPAWPAFGAWRPEHCWPLACCSGDHWQPLSLSLTRPWPCLCQPGWWPPPPNRSALCHLSRTEFTGVQVIFAI
jgi:hypothetical protein